jgi:hypothetical protein
MHPVSERWQEAVRYSHTVDFKATLYRWGEVVEEDIPILAGSVTDNATSNIRKRATLSMAPSVDVLAMLTKDVPENGGLWPTGNEVKILAGLQYEDGTSEYVRMGLFRLARAQLARSDNDLQVAVEGWDRGRTVSRAGFIVPWQVPQGQNYNSEIMRLVLAKFPLLNEDDFTFAATNYKTPNLVFTGPTDDPWDKAQTMAESLGNELIFDGDGKPMTRPLPSPYAVQPVFRYVEGEDCTLLTATRDLSDEQAYNGVIAVGESTSNTAPVRGEAWDTDPNSPTYFDPKVPEASLYGPVPFFMSSQYITTQAQAQDAAINNLGRVKGVVESVSFSAINNYAHESYDPVEIEVMDTGLSDHYILEQITFGLGPGATMSAIARKRRVGLVND